jgi:hypothetical protein
LNTSFFQAPLGGLGGKNQTFDTASGEEPKKENMQIKPESEEFFAIFA